MSPMWLTVLAAAIFSAGLIVTLKLLDALSRPPVNGSLRAMIGRVLRPISARAGQIELGGELWSARSRGEAIDRGRWVRVLDRRGHTLVVASVEALVEDPEPPRAPPQPPVAGVPSGRRRAGQPAGWSQDPGQRGLGPRRLGRSRADESAPR